MGYTRKRGFWSKEVTLFGITMELKYWVAGFIWLIIGIIGLLLIVFFSPLELDLAGTVTGIAGIILSVLTWT